MTDFKYRKKNIVIDVMDRAFFDFYEVEVTYHIAKWGSGYRLKIDKRVDGTKSGEFAHISKDGARKWTVSYHQRDVGGAPFQYGGIWKSLEQAIEAAVTDLYKM